MSIISRISIISIISVISRISIIYIYISKKHTYHAYHTYQTYHIYHTYLTYHTYHKYQTYHRYLKYLSLCVSSLLAFLPTKVPPNAAEVIWSTKSDQHDLYRTGFQDHQQWAWTGWPWRQHCWARYAWALVARKQMDNLHFMIHVWYVRLMLHDYFVCLRPQKEMLYSQLTWPANKWDQHEQLPAMLILMIRCSGIDLAANLAAKSFTLCMLPRSSFMNSAFPMGPIATWHFYTY